MFTPFQHVVRGVAAASVLIAGAPFALAYNTFSDVPTNSEFHQHIDNLHTKGIISGVTGTKFEPMRHMTRGEVSKVVVRAKGMPVNTAGGPHFSDVRPGHTFYEYVETLSNAGVVSGYSDGNYRPEWPVTRGEFSKIVTRTWNMPVDLTGAPHFKDMGESSPSYQYVETLFNNGIINGYPDMTFRQDSQILRQEVAKMIDRTMNKAAFNVGTGARIAVTSNDTSAVANCNSPVTFTVTSFDRFGNVDKANVANATATTSMGTFTTSGTPTQTVAFSNGTATFRVQSCQPGTATLNVTSGTQTASSSATFSANPNQPANTFSITSNPTTVEANCTTPSTVSYTVRDAQGATLTSYNTPVTATITGGGRFISSGGNANTGTTTQTLTPTNGVGSFTVASCQPGTGTVNLQSNNVQNGSGTLTFSSSPAMTPTTVAVSPNSCLQTGTASPVTYTVTINNGNNAALQNAGVVISSTGTPNVTYGPMTSQTTNSSGQVTFTLTAPAGSATGSEVLNFAITPQGGSTPTNLTAPITVQSAAC